MIYNYDDPIDHTLQSSKKKVSRTEKPTPNYQPLRKSIFKAKSLKNLDYDLEMDQMLSVPS